MKNAFEKIIEIYNDEVKKTDNEGFSEKFKLAMKTFEKILKEDVKVKFKDVKYLDGYFIFGTGTNSVVHFKLEETPGWKYGIWWSIPKKYYSKEEKKMVLPKYVEGHFFTQYEENIDKFKPSASTIECEFSIVPGEKHGSLYSITKNIEFIINEPYLAFYRDYTYTDFNHEYVSRRKAKKTFDKYKKQKLLDKKYRELLDNKFIKYVKRCCIEYIANDTMIVIDRGEGWSPRYDIIMKLDEYRKIAEDENLEPGCYELFESGEARDEWYKTLDKLDKIAEKHNVYWHMPFNPSIEVVTTANFNKLRKFKV